MLRWSLPFPVVAIIAGVPGFGGMASAATDFARILFFVFLVLFALALIFLADADRPSLEELR